MESESAKKKTSKKRFDKIKKNMQKKMKHIRIGFGKSVDVDGGSTKR